MMQLDHQKAELLIQKSIDAALLPAEAEALQTHLDSCAQCRTFREEIVDLDGAIHASLSKRWKKQMPASVDLAPVMRKIDESTHSRGWRNAAQNIAWWGAIATVLLVFLGRESNWFGLRPAIEIESLAPQIVSSPIAEPSNPLVTPAPLISPSQQAEFATVPTRTDNENTVPSRTPAPDDNCATPLIESLSELSLYETPSLSSELVAVVDAGISLQPLGRVENGPWWLVSISTGQTGWIEDSNVTFSGKINDVDFLDVEWDPIDGWQPAELPNC